MGTQPAGWVTSELSSATTTPSHTCQIGRAVVVWFPLFIISLSPRNVNNRTVRTSSMPMGMH
jgi:hypothetical protein